MHAELPDATDGALEVRRVVPDDWPAVRRLRLAALEETPTAYGERWSDASVLDDDAWRTRTDRGAEGGDSFQVMAWQDDRPVATATGFVDDGVAWLVGVHVAPDLRGRGLFDLLVERVIAWAGTQEVPALHLEVHEDNPRAAAAYRRIGFTASGRRRPYPLDPSAEELEMVLALAPA